MKKTNLLILAICLLLGAGGIWYRSQNLFPVDSQKGSQVSQLRILQKLEDRKQVDLQIGEKELRVEVVNSNVSRSQGLSGRNTIGSDGMLFVFPQKSLQQFWMKEMRFGLDFIWISDNIVVEITPNVPPPSPDQPLNQLPHYSPKVPVDMILEIPAGKAQEWYIQVGDIVLMRPIK